MPAGRRLNVLNNGKIYQATPSVFPKGHPSFQFHPLLSFLRLSVGTFIISIQCNAFLRTLTIPRFNLKSSDSIRKTGSRSKAAGVGVVGPFFGRDPKELSNATLCLSLGAVNYDGITLVTGSRLLYTLGTQSKGLTC